MDEHTALLAHAQAATTAQANARAPPGLPTAPGSKKPPAETGPASRSNSIKMRRTPSSSARFVEYVPVSFQRYGTVKRNPAALFRSTSMPVHSRRVVFYRKPPRQLTVGQQSAKLAEESKKNFFHGNFTSSHGAVFMVPSRAQQLATTRPSRAPSVGPHGAASRSSSVVRRAASVLLDNKPQASAMKKPPFSHVPLPPQVPGGSGGSGGMLDEAIVVKRRAASADARLRLDVEEYVPPPHERNRLGPRLSFRESSPDLLAVERMRDTNAASSTKPPLSPTTIAKAKRALRAFEDNKVKMPNSSFEGATSVDVDGKKLSVPEKTPLVLTKPRVSQVSEDAAAAAVARRVHINSDIDEAASQVTYEEEEEEEDFEEEDQVGFCAALMDLLYLGVPAGISICFTFSMSVVPLAFVGSFFGERELSGASVGYFIVCIIVFYPMIGLTFAMDTLCSHEYGRDPLSPEMGLILQRGILINVILLTPLCVLIYYLDGMLIALYGPEVAQVAEEFLRFSPLYLFPIMLFIAFNKFLTNQMMPHIPMIALTAGVIVMPLLQLKLTPLGVRYTMLGMAITAWFQLCVVIIMTLFKPETRITLGTWRIRDALDWSDVVTYMKLAIPSAIFVAAEAASFDLTILLCAQFGETDGAAWSAIMNSLFIFASISGGISASACANIGRCIGAGQPNNAKRFVLLSIFCAAFMGVLDSTVFVTFFDPIMQLFGTKGKTLQLAHKIVFMIPFFHIADSVQFTFQGIFSGLGKNHLGAIILLTSLWCIGIPLCFLFGHYLGYNMFGVCVGITIGLCIEAPAMVMAASTMDYHRICEDFLAHQESEKDEETDEEEEEEEEEELNEEYVEEVMRRSGISIGSGEVSEEHAKKYRQLRPPQRRGRRRQVLMYENESD